MNFGVCDFSRLAVTDWRLWFLALSNAPRRILRVAERRGSLSVLIGQVRLLLGRGRCSNRALAGDISATMPWRRWRQGQIPSIVVARELLSRAINGSHHTVFGLFRTGHAPPLQFRPLLEMTLWSRRS